MDDTRKKGITVFEFMVGFIGMVAIAGIILLGAGLGIVLGLPYVITGAIVGVVTTWAIVSGSFAGSREKEKEQEVTLYSAFPTD